MSKLDKIKTYVLATIRIGEGNITQTRTNTKGREPNNIYVEGINNHEYWRVKRPTDKIKRYGQYWYWCPNTNMKGNFDVIYMKHPANKYH